MVGAPPGDFMEAAVRIRSIVLSCRNEFLALVLIHVGCFGNMFAPEIKYSKPDIFVGILHN